MSPLPHSDGHDAPWLTDEVVPGEAAVVDDVVVGFEDAVRQPVIAHELPQVLDGIEFGAARRQRHERNVGRHHQRGRAVPPGLIEYDDSVGARGDVAGYLLQVQAHGLAVAIGHDQPGGLAFCRADRAKDPRRCAALVLGCRWARAPLRPTPGQFGLLADPGLVLPPQLYGRAFGQALTDLRQTGWEVFLKTAISSAFCPQ